MLELIIAFVAGVVVAGVAGFLVVRNNKRRFDELLKRSRRV